MVQSVYLSRLPRSCSPSSSPKTRWNGLEIVPQGRVSRLGCVVAGAGAIVGYFDIGGPRRQSLTLYGRASSTFKDPNVLGSYLVLGALYLHPGAVPRPHQALPGDAGSACW